MLCTYSVVLKPTGKFSGDTADDGRRALGKLLVASFAVSLDDIATVDVRSGDLELILRQHPHTENAELSVWLVVVDEFQCDINYANSIIRAAHEWNHSTPVDIHPNHNIVILPVMVGLYEPAKDLSQRKWNTRDIVVPLVDEANLMRLLGLAITSAARSVEVHLRESAAAVGAGC